MTSPQENKLSMYLTVKTVCDAATAIWTPLVAFATNYAAFLAKVNLIQQMAAAQAADRTGAARDKKGIQETLADATLVVSGALTAYATIENDNTLKEKVDFSRTAFLKQRDNEMTGTAELIHAEAPRASIVGRKTLTGQLVEEFRKSDLLLNGVLDPLMQQYKATQPTFYADYTAARIIIDRPGGIPDEDEDPQPPNP